MSRGDEDGFLSRWSRRKRASEHPAPPGPEPEPAPPPPAADHLPEETDAEILARLELPDPDTLGAGDDFARYLRAPLPEHLRRRALRRLWRSNPVLANLDGLNDYDTDFTGDTVPLGTLKTAYEVGRGFAARALDADSPAAGSAAPEADPERAETQSDESPEVGEDALRDPISGEDSDPVEEMQDTAESCTHRRMVFRFDEP